MPRHGLATTGGRQINIRLDTLTPEACKAYMTKKPLSALPQFLYNERGPVKSWQCEGSVVVDTVTGKSFTFHFDELCYTYSTDHVSAGTVHVVGKGAATFP